MFHTILERIRFWINHPDFSYNLDSGFGWAHIGYDPFSDEVHIRSLQFGYVTGSRWMDRHEYLGRLDVGRWEIWY